MNNIIIQNTPCELGVSDKYNVQTQEIKEVNREILKLPKDAEGLKSKYAEINDIL